MIDEEKDLDIFHILKLKNIELSLTPSIELQQLETSLQSIAKRIEYCKYHFDEFSLFTNKKALLIDRFDSSITNETSTRIRYEAHTVAFLQNLHALIDCFPYTLNIIHPVTHDIENRNIGWNKKFINKYKNFPFFMKLDNLFKNENFQKIKGYANKTKHKHLVKIKNSGRDLIFDKFSYFHNGKEEHIVDQEVELFMMSCHNELIPQVISLGNAIVKSKEKEIENLKLTQE